VAVDVVMEGGASGGMEGAIVDGEHLTMRELVGHGMTWAINGIAGGGEDPLVSVERGRTVVLSVSNRTAWTHALHLHGHHVRIIEEDGRAIDDAVWRDTVLVEPSLRLSPPAQACVSRRQSRPHSWMLQCRVLEHGDSPA
jgi:FtsP/CotA-like multicopper oxidase with cupredoxin domain